MAINIFCIVVILKYCVAYVIKNNCIEIRDLCEQWHPCSICVILSFSHARMPIILFEKGKKCYCLCAHHYLLCYVKRRIFLIEINELKILCLKVAICLRKRHRNFSLFFLLIFFRSNIVFI